MRLRGSDNSDLLLVILAFLFILLMTIGMLR